MSKWFIQGELILNCCCTIFCPCVISLGQHPPTEGYCQAWAGIRIDKGSYDGEELKGLNIGLLLDIPGMMGRGNWKMATYIDERATEAAYYGLVKILSGRVKGSTGLLTLLVSEFLGAERAPIDFTTEGNKRRLVVGKKIKGEVEPIAGLHPDSDVTINNSSYWIAPEVTVATANHGRVRAFGRVWDFDGRSAEICQINWSGQTIS